MTVSILSNDNARNNPRARPIPTRARVLVPSQGAAGNLHWNPDTLFHLVAAPATYTKQLSSNIQRLTNSCTGMASDLIAGRVLAYSEIRIAIKRRRARRGLCIRCAQNVRIMVKYYDEDEVVIWPRYRLTRW